MSDARQRPRPRIFTQLNLAASKLTTNLMLKIYTPNTVNRAYIWLKQVSVVIDNICVSGSVQGLVRFSIFEENLRV